MRNMEEKEKEMGKEGYTTSFTIAIHGQLSLLSSAAREMLAVNRRNNKAGGATLQCGPGRASLFRRFTDANVHGTAVPLKHVKTRQKMSVDVVGGYFPYSV